MAFGEHFDRNSVEGQNSISIEISNPNPKIFPTRIYPIPQNKLLLNTIVKLTIRIVNNTPNPFFLNPYQPFIPEFLTSDSQGKQKNFFGEQIVDKIHQIDYNEAQEIDWWKIRPGISTIFFIRASFAWYNNFIRLTIPAIPDKLHSFICCSNCWLFNTLQEETYQLRFIYNADQKTVPISEPIKKLKAVQKTGLAQLATPPVNIRLAMPLSTDSTAIEVDGVQFKTEMQESVLTITPSLPDANTQLKLGIRATNNTSTPLRFNQLDSLDVTLISEDGKEIEFTSDLMRLWVGTGPNYYLAQPGECAIFVLDGTLSWHSNHFQIKIPNKAGGFYYFRDLKPGKYYLQLIYHVSELKENYQKEQVVQKLWTGWIAMPFVECNLVEPLTEVGV